jgi:hypothetical protein
MHRTVDVVEKGLVVGARAIESRLPIRSAYEPVFGALFVAGEADLTVLVVAQKSVALVEAKLDLLRLGDQLDHVGLFDATGPRE